MKHALIVERDGEVSRAIEDRLSALGFQSFERAWTEEEAVAAAARHVPDLLVVGSRLDAGSPVSAARRIDAAYDVPMLLAAPAAATPRALPADARLEGPFALGRISEAVRKAAHAQPSLAA